MDNGFLTPTLWDVEDAASMPHVRDTRVGHVSSADVQEFCHRYHYTSVGNNAMWRYGLWDGPMLLGVVAYNLPTRSVCASMFGEEYVDNVWHMTRLVLPDAALRNSESRLIAGSLRMIEKEHANVWAVVTYAATDAGHIGYVYQATNAIYTGTGGRPTFHTDETGARRGTHLNGHYIDPERAAALGWTLRKGGIKHRYVYILGTKRQRRSRRAMLRFPSLPYPKQ